MRCVVVQRPGGLDRLELHERPDPRPGPGELRVRTRFAGVNYADCIVRMGLYSSARELVGWPIVPGFDFAGVVDALGEGVEGAVEVGAEVLGATRFGGYATHVVVPAGQVLEKPAALSFEQAAALPTVAVTAWYALFELACPRPGARVLVHSAAGGVGGMLVQMARLAGARAVAVVGAPHKVEAARELGAERVIDKSREDLWSAARAAAPEGYAAVFDANGPSTLRASYAQLAPEGRLVVYGFHSMLPRHGRRPAKLALLWHWLRTPRFDPLRMTRDNRGVLAFNLSYLFHRGDLLRRAMGEVLGWIAGGALRAPRVEVHALEEVAAAQRTLESGRTVGKLVLRT